MLLRLDDLDQERCHPSHAEQIVQDLRWFGIDWQLNRSANPKTGRYQQAIERLQRDQFIYPCFESEEELKAKAGIPPQAQSSPRSTIAACCR